MARKFDSFERQVEIRKLKKRITEQKFEEKQKGELKGLRQETFRRSPTGKIISRVKTEAKKLSALTLKTLKTPKVKGKKVPKFKAFFGEAPKDSFRASSNQPFGGEIINPPFPKQKKKNNDLIF